MSRFSRILPSAAAFLCGAGLMGLAGCATPESAGPAVVAGDAGIGQMLAQAASESVAIPQRRAEAPVASPAPTYQASRPAAQPRTLPQPTEAEVQSSRPVAAPDVPISAPVVASAPADRPVQVAQATDPAVTDGRVVAPHWTVGSEWRYSDGYGLKVTQSDGIKTAFERLDDPAQWFSRRGFLRDEEQSSTAHRQMLFETVRPDAGYSLEVGKPLTFRREYMSNGEQKVHATSWTVEGRETITVPAGTFDCWVIVMRTRNLITNWTAFERWWYSPEVQNYVRLEYRYGPMPTGSRVLMSYSLMGSQQPRVALNDAK